MPRVVGLPPALAVRIPGRATRIGSPSTVAVSRSTRTFPCACCSRASRSRAVSVAMPGPGPAAHDDGRCCCCGYRCYWSSGSGRRVCPTMTCPSNCPCRCCRTCGTSPSWTAETATNGRTPARTGPGLTSRSRRARTPAYGVGWTCRPHRDPDPRPDGGGEFYRPRLGRTPHHHGGWCCGRELGPACRRWSGVARVPCLQPAGRLPGGGVHPGGGRLLRHQRRRGHQRPAASPRRHRPRPPERHHQRPSRQRPRPTLPRPGTRSADPRLPRPADRPPALTGRQCLRVLPRLSPRRRPARWRCRRADR